MICREFRTQHCAFVDDTLSLADMAAMRGHLEECADCANHDTRVRRSLLLVRNAPRLECSSDFGARLQARLREIGPVDRRSGTDLGSPTGFLPTSLRLSTVAAGVIGAAALMTIAAAAAFERQTPEIRMAPVVASIPAPEVMPLAAHAPAYVASVMSGMPVWSAVLGAGQSSIHMANYEFQTVGYAP